jgi:hypothetical protein
MCWWAEYAQPLLKDNPDLVFSKDNEGHPVLHVAAVFGYGRGGIAAGQ